MDGIMLGMANLRLCRARHAPRVKDFPGKPREGNATVIAIPTHSRDRSSVIGKATLRRSDLRRALMFVEENWEALLLYWHEEEFDDRELRVRLSPRKKGGGRR